MSVYMWSICACVQVVLVAGALKAAPLQGSTPVALWSAPVPTSLHLPSCRYKDAASLSVYPCMYPSSVLFSFPVDPRWSHRHPSTHFAFGNTDWADADYHHCSQRFSGLPLCAWCTRFLSLLHVLHWQVSAGLVDTYIHTI